MAAATMTSSRALPSLAGTHFGIRPQDPTSRFGIDNGWLGVAEPDLDSRSDVKAADDCNARASVLAIRGRASVAHRVSCPALRSDVRTYLSRAHYGEPGSISVISAGSTLLRMALMTEYPSKYPTVWTNSAPTGCSADLSRCASISAPSIRALSCPLSAAWTRRRWSTASMPHASADQYSLARVLAGVSMALGMIPGLFCSLCATISGLLGAASALLFWVTGHKSEAVEQLVGAGLGALGQGALKRYLGPAVKQLANPNTPTGKILLAYAGPGWINTIVSVLTA